MYSFLSSIEWDFFPTYKEKLLGSILLEISILDSNESTYNQYRPKSTFDSNEQNTFQMVKTD